MIDETHAPGRRSWVASANQHADFPIQNLPLGIFSPPGGAPRGGVAIGDEIFDLAAALELGLFAGAAATAAQAAAGATLNPLFALGAEARVALAPARRRTARCRRQGPRPLLKPPDRRLLHRAADCRLHLPAAIGDYTDFFAGINHATNAGKLFRPDNPLMPNYKYVPIGYHGRASSIGVSGTDVRRPEGQRKPANETVPTFGPCRNLDYELELGVWIGPGNELGQPIPIAEAGDHIAGFCLLNDWSARDIQGWEYQPLGPFLGKSFFTTVSPWVVTPEALAPFRMAQAPRPAGDPAPLPYLLDCVRPGRRRARHRARGVPAHPGTAGERPAGAPAVVRQCPRPLLDGGAARRAPHLQRLQPAAGRHLRHRHDLRAQRGQSRQPAGDFGRRPSADRPAVRRDAPVPGGRRHRHHARRTAGARAMRRSASANAVGTIVAAGA